jgi:hypothetical protein
MKRIICWRRQSKMAATEKNAKAVQPDAAQPGAVVTPGGAPPAPAPSMPQTELPPTEPEPAAEQPPTRVPTGLKDDAYQAVAPDGSSEEVISWTASEFLAHEKSASWYLVLALAAVAAAGIIYLLTRDTVSSVVVLVGAVIFGIVAARKPRQLTYQIDADGIQVGPKHYPLADFRSFSVVDEGSFSGINLMPLKRFAPMLTVYYDPKDEERIIGVLSRSLPMEEHRHDPVDNLMRRIRF